MKKRCTCCREQTPMQLMNGIWYCPVCDKTHRMRTN